MRRHSLKLLSLWILPLLLARALIPTGFMLSVEAGRLQLMFCPAGAVQPLGTSATERSAHVEHHAHHGGMQHGGEAAGQATSHAAQDSAPCPFSLVASAAPASIAHFANVAIDLRDDRFELLSAPTCHVGPIRTDRARGPPSLA